MRQPKKNPGKPHIVPVGSRITQKGNSTQKPKKPRSTARYVKIRITRDAFAWGSPYFENEKYPGRFVLDAVREKINRVRSGIGRLQKITTGYFQNVLESITAELI